MRRHLALVGLIALIGTIGDPSLLACGDKFLHPGVGSRFQRAPIPRVDAAVLVYATPRSTLPQALARLSVDAMLRKAGYRTTSVTTAEEFERAITRGGWDVVLVDLADAAAVHARIGGASGALLVAVAQDVSRAEAAHARKEYAAVLKSPTRGQAFVEAIDDALAARPAQRAAAGLR
jgi:hypothetical protein